MKSHHQRIKDELKSVGVSWYGMRKFAVKYLPKIIHKDEHVQGIVYGRYREKHGPNFSEGLLVATDRRVLFVDHKPGYTDTDEISYDMIAGVEITRAGFSAVTLQTRMGDFTLRFANPKSARIFVNYVSERSLEANK